MTNLEAIGPDGGTVLGFMASVGALAVLERVWGADGCQLGWRENGGWRPVFRCREACGERDLAEAISEGLQGRATALESSAGDDINLDADAFGDLARRAVEDATPADRTSADFVAAFACDVITQKPKATVETTRLRLLTGAGHQSFLKTIRELRERTSASQIHAALFAPWAYDDPGPTLRFDSIDYRVHALRADDPSSSEQWPIRTVAGANALATEAVRCFPVAPDGQRLATTGVVRVDRRTYFSWPVWEGFLDAPTLRSVLGLADWRAPAPSAMAAMGVAEVFRAERLKVTDRIVNFGTAFAVTRER